MNDLHPKVDPTITIKLDEAKALLRHMDDLHGEVVFNPYEHGVWESQDLCDAYFGLKTEIDKLDPPPELPHPDGF